MIAFQLPVECQEILEGCLPLSTLLCPCDRLPSPTRMSRKARWAVATRESSCCPVEGILGGSGNIVRGGWRDVSGNVADVGLGWVKMRSQTSGYSRNELVITLKEPVIALHLTSYSITLTCYSTRWNQFTKESNLLGVPA